jgi:hypothetical protein
MGQKSSKSSTREALISLSHFHDGLRSKLSIILEESILCAALEEFLRIEHSADNLSFLLQIKDQNISPLQIYNEFCLDQSPKSLFLSQKTKNALRKAAESNQMTKEDFSSAASEIGKLIAQDSLPRFLESDIFKDIEAKYS